MIINDIQISRLLESSTKAKERFKLIYDAQTFDPTALIRLNENASANDKLKAAKEANMTLDKKINMLRLQRSLLKQALIKKYRKTITDKILQLFENQYFQLQNMTLSGYYDMIQANFMQQCSV